MKNKQNIIDVITTIIVIILCAYWAITGDKVGSDPYLLGLFRGFIYPTILLQLIKMQINNNGKI